LQLGEAADGVSHFNDVDLDLSAGAFAPPAPAGAKDKQSIFMAVGMSFQGGS